MPRKVRELVRDLRKAGLVQEKRSGEGSHRKSVHPTGGRRVTISGADGVDAKTYQ